MPIYQYRCPECGHEFDKLKLTRADMAELNKCPGCGSCALRQLTAASFRINGYNERNGYAKRQN